MKKWSDNVETRLDGLERLAERTRPEYHAARCRQEDERIKGTLARVARRRTVVRLSDAVGSAAAAQAAAIAASQPLDSDLTAIAALTTTSFGRALLTEASAATARTTLGIGTAPVNLTTNLTPVLSTATTSEEDLMTYSLPAGTLATTKDRVEIVAWGAFGAAARTKQIKLYFGSTVLFDTAAVLLASTDFQIRATVYRTGAATQVSIAAFDGDTVLVTTTSLRAAPTETLSGAVTIKCSSTVGAGASAGDTRQSGLRVDYAVSA